MTNTDGDTRLQVVRQELQKALAETALPHPERSYSESVRDSDATVLAFDVSRPATNSCREDLVGAAIHDGQTLFLAVRRGNDWRIARPSAR